MSHKEKFGKTIAVYLTSDNGKSGCWVQQLRNIGLKPKSFNEVTALDPALKWGIESVVVIINGNSDVGKLSEIKKSFPEAEFVFLFLSCPKGKELNLGLDLFLSDSQLEAAILGRVSLGKKEPLISG